MTALCCQRRTRWFRLARFAAQATAASNPREVERKENDGGVLVNRDGRGKICWGCATLGGSRVESVYDSDVEAGRLESPSFVRLFRCDRAPLNGHRHRNTARARGDRQCL